jgi:2-hydroxychromene-2-carboxylate isomerase
MTPLIFWFDPASTYSYLAAMRIDGLAATAGVEVEWRPFLLGPIFKAQGLDNSPFRIFPVKGLYMWRDMAREAEAIGAPLRIPEGGMLDGFPRNSVLAARASIVALRESWGRDFVRAIYQSEFAEWRDIADPAVIASICAGMGHDPETLLTEAQSDATKAQLRANTAEAEALGVFGAPSFTCRGELFWGNDRIERALEFAAGKAR